MKLLCSLVVFFLLSHDLRSSETLIRDSCRRAAEEDPSLRYRFCVASLEGIPGSKNACLQGLVDISIKRAVSYATRTQEKISEILKDKKYHRGCEIPLRDCLEIYSDAKDSLTEALGDIKSRDYGAVNVCLSSALDAPSTCETGFKEKMHQRSPLTKENNIFFQMVLISSSLYKHAEMNQYMFSLFGCQSMTYKLHK